MREREREREIDREREREREKEREREREREKKVTFFVQTITLINASLHVQHTGNISV